MRKPILFLFLVFSSFLSNPTYSQVQSRDSIVHWIFTSDAHYGINRKKFRGDSMVPSYKVNRAMIQSINSLPGTLLPQDNGVESGKKIGSIEYIIETGDIANRMEIPIQSAAISWSQFKKDYFHRFHLKGRNGKKAQIFLVPGNHDISNAVGFAKPMSPLRDPSSMVNIYNLMMKPQVPLKTDTYQYPENRINYSRNIQGIHFMFITLWPDSAQRIWMEKDLDSVDKKTPVLIFTHDQPAVEAKHFTNPIPPYTMTLENKFENLLEEKYKEGPLAKSDGGNTQMEQRSLVAFFKKHENIKAYFHGNNNWNEFYTYSGPDQDISLPVFRVDSPIKGRYSADDESKLSFQFIALDTKNRMLTARECLWNIDPTNKKREITFGKSQTISLKVD